jgi:hypothetical protein
MGVHDPAHLGHVLVNLRVGGCVRERTPVTLNQVAVWVADHHRLRVSSS